MILADRLGPEILNKLKLKGQVGRTIHKTLQSKMSFSKISKFSAMIPKQKQIFPLPPLISFKRDKNIGHFLVRSEFHSNNQSEIFTCKRTRFTTCPFISGPIRSARITHHFTCVSAKVIYCITCTLCKKICMGQSRRRLADRFREHLRDAEENDADASKPVAPYFNLPNQSHHNTTICGMSLHHGNTRSRKNLG